MLLTIIWIFIILITLRQYQAMFFVHDHYRQCPFFTLCYCTKNGFNETNVNKFLLMFHCKSAEVYKFPDIPYERIDRLVIHGSKITNLEFESLSSLQIQSLILSENRIQTIYSKSFSSSEKSLKQLDLSHNQLHSIPFKAIVNLKNINYLNLQNNEINSIFGHWQHLHNSLRSLLLANNDINQLEQENYHHQDLRELNSLVWLSIDDNTITNISIKSLPTTLQTLSLSRNHLKHFPYGILTNFPLLRWVSLKGNYIAEIGHSFRTRSQIWMEKIDLAENLLYNFPNLTYPNENIIVRDLNLSFNFLKGVNFGKIRSDRLILSYNEISEIDEKAFRNVAKTLTYLDLDHNFIREIPRALKQLEILKYLYLSSNNILLSNFEIFYMSNFTRTLKALSLSNNYLKTVPNLPNLEYLNMGYNEIFQIPKFGCANLHTLLLHNNRLTDLRPTHFNSCHKLQELNLSFNPIRTIDSHVFANLSNLRSLEMAFNDLDESYSDFLKPLSSVQWLLFDSNSFKRLPESFMSLTRIQYVNFEWNKLKQLPSSFNRLNHLEDLRLGYNYFEHIDRDQFSDLKRLRSIFLNGNQIRVVETRAFLRIPLIELIVICDNLINTIEGFSFVNLPRLRLLNLQRNRLKSINFNMFHNVATNTEENGMTLNLSRNLLRKCEGIDQVVNIAKIDFSLNEFQNWPYCLVSVSRSLQEIDLNGNLIGSLEHQYEIEKSNYKFNTLQTMKLNHNRIRIIDKDFFRIFPELQMLDLSVNQLNYLDTQQFMKNSQLRLLNLSSNSLTYLPKDIFEFCKLEMLDLSSNRFSAIPKSAINIVSLRFLSIDRNLVDYVDSTMLWKLLNLETLNLGDNRITVLADNVFSNMAKVRHLSLTGNLIRANFKELFHYAHDLFELDFSRNDLSTIPILPLPNLIKLNVAYNEIDEIFSNSTDNLIKLKYLFLNNNRLRVVPKHIWPNLSNLKFLDLSGNLFKELDANSFRNLNKLKHLHLNDLKCIQNFQNDVFQSLKYSLQTLSVGLYGPLQHNQKKLCHIFLKPLEYLKSLEIVEENPKFRDIHVTKDILACLDERKHGRKLEKITLRGSSIAKIEHGALEKLSKSIRLEIEIAQTEIDELPVGLFSHFNRIGRLKITLRRNLLLSFLSPETFYSNASSWEKIGTKLITDGLIIEDHNWQCGCHLAWLGHWYRRWIHESLQLYNQPPEAVLETYNALTKITCLNSNKNFILDDDLDESDDQDDRDDEHLPIINLLPEEMQCQASALNYANDLSSKFCYFVAIFLLFL